MRSGCTRHPTNCVPCITSSSINARKRPGSDVPQGRLARWFGLANAPTPARTAYGLWADTYPPWPHNPLMQAEQRVVAPLIAAARPVTALDVGTGTGRYLPHLS